MLFGDCGHRQVVDAGRASFSEGSVSFGPTGVFIFIFFKGRGHGRTQGWMSVSPGGSECGFVTFQLSV